MKIKIWKAITENTTDGVGYDPAKTLGKFRSREEAVDFIAKLEFQRRKKRKYKSKLPVDIHSLLKKSNCCTGEDWNHWEIKEQTVNIDDYLSILTDEELISELKRRGHK